MFVLCYYITYRWQYKNCLFFFVIILPIGGNMRMVCYPQTKSEGYSFGFVCVSFRPHFLSVWNHISVPIGQI